MTEETQLHTTRLTFCHDVWYSIAVDKAYCTNSCNGNSHWKKKAQRLTLYSLRYRNRNVQCLQKKSAETRKCLSFLLCKQRSCREKVNKNIIFKLILSRDTKQMRSKNILRFFLQTSSLERSCLYIARNCLYIKDKGTKNSYESQNPCGFHSKSSGKPAACQLSSNDNTNLLFWVF